MDILSKMRNSWEITKTCFKILGKEKMLVLYPMISMFAMGIVLMIFFGLFIFAVLADQLAGENGLIAMIGTMVLVWLMYIALYFVMIFSNVAIVGCANMRLDGKDPVFKDGFRIAMGRIGPILGWAVVAGTVGLILNMLKNFLEKKLGALGKFIGSMLGLAWNAITYFVVPIIAAENMGPFKSIKRSTQILKKTWGEALTVNFGIGFVYAIVLILYIVIWIVLLVVTSVFWPLMLAVLALGFLGLLGLWATYTALKGILMAVLYRYAMTGDPGFGFEKNHIQAMFSSKA